MAEGLLHLLDLRDIQGVIGTVAWYDKRGYRHAKRVEGGHGDLDLRQISAIFAMPELDVPSCGENIRVSVNGGGIDAKKGRIELVNSNGVLVEGRFTILPVAVQRELVEHVSKAVILEIERTNGFAQANLEGVQVGLGPGLKLGQSVIALGSEEGDPNAGNLSESQLALPAVPRRVVAIEDLGHVQAL